MMTNANRNKQRPDIAKLSPQKLSHIANKGVVKRAQKAIEQGDIPNLDIADNLTLTAQFSDNSKVSWAPTCAIYDSVCSCPASAVVLCRHQIQTVLAYRHAYCQMFGTESLLDMPAYLLSAKQVSAAAHNKTRQQALKALGQSGIDIVLSFTEHDPCAMARLSMATVHFWGGNALHECTCDCKKKLGCEHIILAATAFAKQSTPITTPTTITVSKTEATKCLNGIEINNTKADDIETNDTAIPDNESIGTTYPSAAKTSATIKKMPPKFTPADLLQACSQFSDNVVSDDFMPNMLVHTLSLLTDNERLLFTQFYHYGISNSTDATIILIDDIYQDNKQRHYLWLNDILITLKDWLSAYHKRRSDFDLSQGNQLISEYLLRRLAGKQPTLASVSLGVDIKAQTDMRPMQLISLGCNISVHDGNYQAQTLLLDNKSQTPLLLQSTWQLPSTDPNTFSTLNPTLNPVMQQQYRETRQQRITADITLAQLQHGQLSTQRSHRSANHSITLNKSRRAYNQLIPYCISAETLAALPVPLSFRNITQLRHYYRTRSLSFARARHQQPNFVILPIDELLFIGYDAAQQTVGAIIQTATTTAPDDTLYWIKMSYRSHSPYALSLLAEISNNMTSSDKADNDALPHHVSGTLSWERFGDSLIPVIIPWAIFYHDRSVVLALDLPEHLYQQANKPTFKNSQATDSQKHLAAVNWQESPALSQLPLVDFSHRNSTSANNNTNNDLVNHVLASCQNWLDNALIYGAQSLPNSFWKTQRQLIMQAQQAGLKQLVNSLKMMSTSTIVAPTSSLSIDEYLLMLVIQLAVIDEMTTVMSYQS